MNEFVFIENHEFSLIKYSHDNDKEMYECWLDIDTQKGYNFIFDESFEEFSKIDIARFHFYSVILHKQSQKSIGVLRLSPSKQEPDLAIWMFKPYRNKGYGRRAFVLGLQYCFRNLNLEKVWAGCYENNTASMKMLEKIGFNRDYLGDVTEIDAFNKSEIKQLSYVITQEQYIEKLK